MYAIDSGRSKFMSIYTVYFVLKIELQKLENDFCIISYTVTGKTYLLQHFVISYINFSTKYVCVFSVTVL